MLCERKCGAQRLRVYDPQAFIIASRLVYTDREYLMPRGTGRLDPAAQAALRREKRVRQVKRTRRRERAS
jgi:hypothetical protein